MNAIRPFHRCAPGAALRMLVVLAVTLASMPAALAQAPSSGAGSERTGPSGLPLPRFVSLRSDRINVRVGPGQDYAIAWIFTRAGLPVEITAESGNWRRIRDSDGAEGWIFHSLLSGRRTAVVSPWSNADTVSMKRSADRDSADAALVEPSVLVDVNACNGGWCRVTVQNMTGWIEQQRLWGVYPDETIR